jgi:hypothetical protein
MANTISIIVDVATGAALGKINAVKASMASVEGTANKMKAGASTALAGMGGAAVAATAALGGLFVIGQKSIAQASQLEESMNAVNVSYGKNAEAVHKLGQDSVESFGLSEQAFNQAAVTFSSFAENVAGEGGNVVGTLEDLMGRAVDFASVMNMNVNDAMRIFTSTLAGETEAIRRYGIDMSAAAVQEFALAQGMIKNKRELTGAIKMQAQYGLLMQRTEEYAGDFKNTSDSLANSQRRLSGQIENLQAGLGNTLIPIVANVTDGFADAAAAANDFIDTLERIPGIELPDLPDVPGWIKRNVFDNTVFGQMFGLGEQVVRISDNVGDFVGGAAKGFTNWLGVTQEETKGAARQAEEYNGKLMGQLNVAEQATNRQRELSRAIAAGETGLSDAALATDNYSESMAESRDASREAATAADDLRRARQDLANDTLSVLEAEIAFREQVAASQEVLANTKSLDEAATAMIDTVRAAESVAQAQLDLKNQTKETAIGMDTYNQSMLAQAATLDGPLQDAILRHVATQNGIPDEKVTQLLVDANPDNLAQITEMIMLSIAGLETQMEIGGTAIGQRLGDGVQAGIESRSGAVERAAEIMVEKALRAAQVKGGIRS